MVHSSVRRRVTVWYTLIIVILLVSVIAILLAAMSVSSSNSKEEKKDKLSDTVRLAIEELSNDRIKGGDKPSDIKKPDGKEEERQEDKQEERPEDKQGEKQGDRIKDRDGAETSFQAAITNFVTYKNGVNFIIYDESGAVVKGQLPEDITLDIPFAENKFTEYSSAGANYIIYDSLLTKRNLSPAEKQTSVTYRIRGITPLNTDNDFLRNLIIFSLILIPFFVIIASFIGYRITKSAFKPIKQVTDMAKSIAESGDLTQRIGLKSNNGKSDEIHVMADTFDNMLENIEDQFEARKRFTDDASHELRTPIAVIIGQCELAENEKADKDQIADSIHVIKRQARKMSKLVSQLLMFARVDKGKEKLNIEEIDLSETVEIASLELSEEVNDKNITVSTDIEPDIMFKCDQTMITRLIINLVTNAVKYGKENGRVKVTLSKDQKEITMRVIDDGVGIARENLDKIWERFFRVDPSRSKEDDSSSGLGLPISKWIVEAHGGKISVDSELGLGSTFTVVFPVNC
ncbi:MAG: HAMP domain-containing histidine kinase [Clostridia bacterium]|nr:HAMP domain-containing histidine kinase [Clostridia bacterium]